MVALASAARAEGREVPEAALGKQEEALRRCKRPGGMFALPNGFLETLVSQRSVSFPLACF